MFEKSGGVIKVYKKLQKSYKKKRGSLLKSTSLIKLRKLKIVRLKKGPVKRPRLRNGIVKKARLRTLKKDNANNDKVNKINSQRVKNHKLKKAKIKRTVKRLVRKSLRLIVKRKSRPT